MAALDISHVVALSNYAQRLALEQGKMGHAAAKYGAAVEAARALGPAAGEDCLIVTRLMLQQAEALCIHALLTESKPDSDADDVLRFANFELLPAAQGALLRQKAERTLLGGACRQHEVAWELAFLKQAAKIEAKASGTGASDWSDLALHIGYRSFLKAALSALRLMQLDLAPTLYGFAFEAQAAFVTEALELMALPRRGRSGSHALTLGDRRWAGEVSFVRRCLQVEARGGFSADKDDVAAMLAAWHALKRSGALEERGCLLTEGVGDTHSADLAAVAHAAYAPERRRACALGSCGMRETYPAQHKLCAACGNAAYCCREHQVAHWAEHKAACKAARGAKAAAKQQ